MDIGVFNKVLALGAHTDDIELGCGATLARLRRSGAAIHAIALSRAELSLPLSMPRDTLEREFRSSMAVLGAAHAQVGGFPVRHFPAHRQEILEELVITARSLKPDLVLTHATTDRHQDHEVVHAEAIRAFRGATILGFDIPWNQTLQNMNLHVEVAEEDVQLKERMLAEYRSQVTLGRGYIDRDFVHTAAKFRGYQSRLKLAEAFELIDMSWRL